MSEEANKKIGIVIPEECGKAEEYELTAIMYQDENSDAAEEEYQVFITEDDYNEGKAFTVLNANMNPEILLYPDENHEGIGCLEYDLVIAADPRGGASDVHRGFRLFLYHFESSEDFFDLCGVERSHKFPYAVTVKSKHSVGKSIRSGSKF